MSFIEVSLTPRRQRFEEQCVLGLRDEVRNVLFWGEEKLSD